MALSLLPYELSGEPGNDLDEILEFSIKQFGIEQAIKYLTGFEQVFETPGRNPEF